MTHLVAEFGREQARVQRRQRFAFRLQDFPKPEAQFIDVRRPLALALPLAPSLVEFDHELWPRPGCYRDDMSRIQQALRLLLHRSHERIALVARVQVTFVQREQHRPALRKHGAQRN